MSEFYSDALGLLLSPSAKASRLAGRDLGPWRLEQIVPHGEGGFGVVYRATHAHLGLGAVKVFSFDLNDDPARRAAFKREVDVLKRITQSDEAPRLVKIYDAGVFEGSLPWIAMSFIEGEPLSRLLQRLAQDHRSMAPGDVVSILCDVLRALEGLSAAYGGAGVVHRDIKPSNVMVEKGEGSLRARLIDFGISRVFDLQEPALAAEGQTREAFTPLYGSPELRAGWRKITDGRSDIFQVGLLGYEMLTGRRYWEDWPAVWEKPDEAAPENSSADHPSDVVMQNIGRVLRVLRSRWTCPYPRSLINAVTRALDWDRGRRFADAESFVTALRSPLRGAVSPQNLWRHRVAIAAIVACATAAIVMSWLAWGVLIDARKLTETQRVEIATLQSQIVTLENRTGQKNYPGYTLSRIRDIHKALSDGVVGEAQLDELRGFCDEFLSSPSSDKTVLQKVSQLRDWLDAAHNGKIRVTIRQFNESKYLGRNWHLAYRIQGPGDAVKSGDKLVTGKIDVNEWLDVPWQATGAVTITVTEDDKHYKGTCSKQLQDPVLLHDGAGWQELRTDQEPNLKLWYTMERLGFGPLPASP